MLREYHHQPAHQPAVAVEWVPPIRRIARAVAAREHISVEALMGPNRSDQLARARWLAWFAGALMTRSTLSAQARAYNRHHTTVMHGITKAAELFAEDRDFRLRCRRVIMDLVVEFGEDEV